MTTPDTTLSPERVQRFLDNCCDSNLHAAHIDRIDDMPTCAELRALCLAYQAREQMKVELTAWHAERMVWAAKLGEPKSDDTIRREIRLDAKMCLDAIAANREAHKSELTTLRAELATLKARVAQATVWLDENAAMFGDAMAEECAAILRGDK